MILPSQRHLFDIPDDICYLNCAYMSPQMHAVRDAGLQAVSAKSRPWQITPHDFFADSETSRELFARLVGGDAGGVAIIPSVSYGMAIAAANVEVRAGQCILVLEEQFPSHVYQWMELAAERGAELVTVRRPADDDWTAALLEHIDASTALAAVPNCHWTDGSLIDLVRIGGALRDVGAALVVDATQSLGAYPLNVADIKPDFLVAATYKWLLGPYSLGFLYAGEKHRSGKPIEHNWIARSGSENFGGLVEYKSSFQPGARRYDMGERSNFALLPMALAAMRQILDWEVSNIAETIGGLSRRIETRASRLGIAATPSERRVPHLLGLRVGSGDSADIAGRLAAANVYVSVRGDRLRVAPHLYNSSNDIDRFFAVLEEIV
ncbi:MAG: aminotransferase class V-fold PLP-dependent enzyme [Woeseia sp.]